MTDWKTIEEYPAYEVSNTGFVRRDNRQLKNRTDRHGYATVTLYRPGCVKKNAKVHTLVLKAFCPPRQRPDQDQCAHYDGDKLNNHFSNLRWASAQENADDRARHDTNAYGERNGMAKMTDEIIIEIKTSAEPHVVIAARLNISADYIKKVRNGVLWAHVKVQQPKRAHAGAKLTDDEVRAVRASTEKASVVAKQYGISRKQVVRLRNRERRASVSD